MPRRIDTDERAVQIAEASLRVLERDGLAGLSVRGVAEEANVATASLRRAFPTQHSLRVHCLELIEERATNRIRALDLTGRAFVDELLAQLLPLDRERRLELVAQIQLGVLALTDAELQPSARRLNDAVDRGCRLAIDVLAEAAELEAGRDLDYEARRLRALLDGVAMHMLWSGDPDDAARMRDTLNRHLDELSRSA
ncbi:TetR/AcrR family transcriptional regulator [Leifsonia sp. NPDC058292]|uniref:TetR/AcrR family transcriptional regulator n=1 Tax=Leifsonia sp. NPDC058292 TaxID=3346428 RepID=UPI0036DEEE83